MIRLVSIGYLLVILMTEPATAQTVGQTFSGSVSLPTNVQSKLYVPLPEGVWRVVATGKERSTISNVEVPRIFLAQVKGKTLSGIIRVIFNNEVPDRAWTIPRDCTRQNLFFRVPDASTHFDSRRGYNCLTINHVGMTSGRKASQSVKDLYNWVFGNTTGMPRVMISAKFVLSDSAQVLHITYYRNPEQEGFPPARDATWRSSEWHYDRLPGDSARMAYVNRIKEWALSWKPQVETGFRGQPYRASKSKAD
jgi:hypothetical protein